MIDLAAIGREVPTPWVERPEPAPGHGRLGELAGWLAAAQGQWPPREPARPRLVAVSTGDWDDSELAAIAGLTTRVVRPTGDVEPALAAGIAAADAEADEGADLAVVVGTGADVAAAAAAAALTDLEPAAAVALGPDDVAWRRDVVAVRDLLRSIRPHADTPYALLSTVDSAVLSALAGVVLQASVRRTPVVLDGLAACAAAATVYRLAPYAAEWWLVADRGESPAQHSAVGMMRLRPVLELGTEAGHAGPLVVPLLRAAARLAAARNPDGV
jgi:NaMN:DMB phosphoribosyltransferase